MSLQGMVAGVDEAGRGPLAGSVVAAAVILEVNRPILGLKDSKQLSEKQRELLYEQIVLNALAYAVGSADVHEIDRINILQATLLAMQRAVKALSVTPTLVLVDGNQAPNLPCTVQTIIQGDCSVESISAASILAKVVRDRQMREYATHYPEYGFADHKGYGTKRHLDALYHYGPTPIHRRSFAPVRHALALHPGIVA